MSSNGYGWRTLGVPTYILLFGVLLSHLGSNMVLPLLPIFLKLQKGMTVENIGIILGLSPFMFQAGSLLGGVLADRIGRRFIIALGAWINSAALIGYATFNDFWLFVSMGLVSGLGVGLNAPATKAAITVLASESGNVASAFSIRGIAANIGTSTAGVISFFILGGASSSLFYTAASIFAVLGVMSWFALPKGCGSAPCETVPIKKYKDIFKNRAFVVFSLISIVIWAIYTQLSLSMPLRAETILPDPSAVSLIWTINSVVVIFLQTPITRLFLERIHPIFSLALGMIFIGAGLGSIYWANSFGGLVFCGVLFIFGEMFIVPTMDITVSQLGVGKMLGVFFGVSNFVMGLGESAGKFAGGQLLSAGTSSILPWFIYASSAAIMIFVLLWLRRWGPMQAALPRKAYSEPSGKQAASWLDRIPVRKRRAK